MSSRIMWYEKSRGTHFGKTRTALEYNFLLLFDEVWVACPGFWGGGGAGNYGAILEWATGNSKPVYEILSEIKASFPPPFENAGFKLHVHTRCKVDCLKLCTPERGDAKKSLAASFAIK
jgi:hypothetical protein